MKTFYVVDGHSQLFRAYHAVGYLSTSKGIPTQAVLILSTMLWKLIREEEPDYLAVAWDPPGPTFRDALSAEYKATRAAMPDDLVRQLPYVRRLFEALRIPVIEVAGFEADDVLATLVERALALPDLEIVVVTGDKDLLQLVGPRVRVLSVSGRTGEPVLYDEAKVRERWGVEPGQIADVLALMGDTIDNIKGVHGVGEKTAVKLVGQFGSVARLYEHLPLVAGEPLALDWAGEARPPDPSLAGVAIFHPAAGAARLAASDAVALGGREVLIHDAKPVLEAWLGEAATLPPIQDSAVAAYLLNPARANYRLEDLCLEAFGECPPPLPEATAGGGEGSSARNNTRPEPSPSPAVTGVDLGGILAERARWVHRYWAHVAAELRDKELWRIYEEIERPLVPVLARMERHGIRVDPERLGAFAKELERSLDNLTREIWQLAGEEFTIASPKQLAHILFEKLGLPALRRTKTGYSTDADVLTELALRHPLPAQVLEHRMLAKLKGTYADTLPALVNPRTGRIHTTFNQLVATTGRLSSQDPNLMNIPIRTELGRRIRAAFIPAQGWRFVAADYSQIELRILAHLSGDPAIIEAFRRGEDIHRRTASEVFRVAPAEVTPLQRTIAKSANFAILYGVSAFGLSQATKIDQKEAQRYITDYFATHPRVRAFIDATLAFGREHGFVTTLLGRRRYLPDLRSANPIARNAAERMAMNAPVQGTASDMIKIAMVRMQAALEAHRLRARMLLQVHDELLFEAPPEEVAAVEALAREIMELALPLQIPLVVDVKSGADWAEV